MLNRSILEKIDFDKMGGLVPAIVVHFETRNLLMQGFMNRKALEKTIEIEKVTFYSRSKERLWTKGETSENYLYPKRIVTDCDYDSLLIYADPAGPTCHTGANSCFFNEVWRL